MNDIKEITVNMLRKLHVENPKSKASFQQLLDLMETRDINSSEQSKNNLAYFIFLLSTLHPELLQGNNLKVLKGFASSLDTTLDMKPPKPSR